MRLHGKTVAEIVSAAMDVMRGKYGSLGAIGDFARENMTEWLQELDRDDITWMGVLGRCEMLVRELIYDRVLRVACEDNERCMDYVMECVGEGNGVTSIQQRAEYYAKEYFDSH
jgi:hypothetical protein